MLQIHSLRKRHNEPARRLPIRATDGARVATGMPAGSDCANPIPGSAESRDFEKEGSP